MSIKTTSIDNLEVQVNEYGDPVKICDECRGAGKVMDEWGDIHECEECHGKGYIIL